MGKRSDFKRVERDFYPTPMAAVTPILPFLDVDLEYDEPCAGDGALVNHLFYHDINVSSCSDIEPQQKNMNQQDALKLEYCKGDMFITNPPWDRKILHPLITHLSNLAPLWLLFDADWMHTKQAAAYMHRCEMIVSIGRVKWIPNSPSVGKDNCCWYFFKKNASGETRFYGR